MSKEIVTLISFTCPDCHYRGWGIGNNIGDKHYCMCSIWRWDGDKWYYYDGRY